MMMMMMMMRMMMMFSVVITIIFTNLNLYTHNYHHCKIIFSRRTEKKKTNIYCLFTMIAPTFKSSENYQTIKSNLPEKNWRLSFQGPKTTAKPNKNQPGDLEDGQIVHRKFGKKKLCLLKPNFW